MQDTKYPFDETSWCPSPSVVKTIDGIRSPSQDGTTSEKNSQEPPNWRRELGHTRTQWCKPRKLPCPEFICGVDDLQSLSTT